MIWSSLFDTIMDMLDWWPSSPSDTQPKKPKTLAERFSFIIWAILVVAVCWLLFIAVMEIFFSTPPSQQDILQNPTEQTGS